jgi:hypothetical protein
MGGLWHCFTHMNVSKHDLVLSMLDILDSDGSLGTA